MNAREIIIKAAVEAAEQNRMNVDVLDALESLGEHPDVSAAFAAYYTAIEAIQVAERAFYRVVEMENVRQMADDVDGD